jgi:hypothetical protein
MLVIESNIGQGCFVFTESSCGCMMGPGGWILHRQRGLTKRLKERALLRNLSGRSGQPAVIMGAERPLSGALA